MSEKAGNASGGESIDRAAHEAVRLAHRALERFPELVRKHKFIAGGAAVSTSLIVLAGVAIARRMRAGQTSDEALATVTEDEVQGLRVVAVAPTEPEPAVGATASDQPVASPDAPAAVPPGAAPGGTAARPALATVPTTTSATSAASTNGTSTNSAGANGTTRTEAGH